MQRKQFLLSSMLSLPALAWAKSSFLKGNMAAAQAPFVVDAGKSRFGEVVKFLGVHPNAFHEIENKAPEREFRLSEG
jgi:hypothetical protein